MKPVQLYTAIADVTGLDFAPTGDDEANRLVATDPLALLIGMLLDQQVAIELAFIGPIRLRDRLGRLDSDEIASIDTERLETVFAEKPALHRFPASMARRTQALCRHLVDAHGGSAALWEDGSTATEVQARLSALPGFGEEKTMILTAVLAKRFGFRPRGWKHYAGAFADSEPRSVADMGTAQDRERVREWKKQQRASGRTKQD